MIFKEYVAYVKGHKDSKGNAAPWVVKQHTTGKILSSHPSEEKAKEHLAQMEMHKHMESLQESYIKVPRQWVNGITELFVPAIRDCLVLVAVHKLSRDKETWMHTIGQIIHYVKTSIPKHRSPFLKFVYEKLSVHTQPSSEDFKEIKNRFYSSSDFAIIDTVVLPRSDLPKEYIKPDLHLPDLHIRLGANSGHTRASFTYTVPHSEAHKEYFKAEGMLTLETQWICQFADLLLGSFYPHEIEQQCINKVKKSIEHELIHYMQYFVFNDPQIVQKSNDRKKAITQNSEEKNMGYNDYLTLPIEVQAWIINTAHDFMEDVFPRYGQTPELKQKYSEWLEFTDFYQAVKARSIQKAKKIAKAIWSKIEDLIEDRIPDSI